MNLSSNFNLLQETMDHLHSPEYALTLKICAIAGQISDTYLWILLAVGFPGNVLTIVTILSMQTMSPATFFVALLAVFDGSALVAKVVAQQIFQHKVAVGDGLCKMEFMLFYLTTVANWMLVLICAERFFSVCYPLKRIALITRRRSYIATAVVSGFFLIVFGAMFITMRTSSVVGNCNTKETYLMFWKNHWIWINASLFLFIPFLLIFIFTAGIIRGLIISRRDRKSLHQTESDKKRPRGSTATNNQRMIEEAGRLERAITIMMIVTAALFLALCLPACIYYLMNPLTDAKCDKSLAEAKWNLFTQIQHVLVDMTHAINFFLYFIAAKRFRHQLFKLLRCKTCKKETYKTKYQHTFSTQLSNSSRINNSISFHPTVQ